MRIEANRPSFTEQGMRGVLIPVGKKHLLLPNVAVAEIISYREPQPQIDTPNWFLGILDWRGLKIPVITWERLVEKSEPAWKTQRMYIVILNTLNKNPVVTHIGLLSVGISRLTRIRADILEEDQEAAIISPLIKSSVKVTNATADSMIILRAWIPDLDQLEKLITPFSSH